MVLKIANKICSLSTFHWKYFVLDLKIFRDQNIHQVFQLLFNILHSGEPGMTQQYAVDLFVDIVQYEKIQQSLIK